MIEAIYALSALLLISNAYWAWNTQVLLNKLMSRNYHEFKAASVTPEEPKTKIVNNYVDDLSSMSEFN